MAKITVSMTNFQKDSLLCQIVDAHGNNVAANGITVSSDTPALLSVQNVVLTPNVGPKSFSFDVVGNKAATAGGVVNITAHVEPGGGLRGFDVAVAQVNVAIDPREPGPAADLNVSDSGPIDQ